MTSRFGLQLEKIQTLPWRSVAVLMAISFVLATLVSIAVGYLLVPSSKSGLSTTPSAATAPTGVVEGLSGLSNVTLSKAEIDAILERNIFNSEGSVGADSPAKARPSNELTKSDLPVSLIGTIYGGTPFNGIAVIESTAREKQINTFMVGDILLKEATIKEIYAEKVILERAGHREYLEIKKEELKRTSRKAKAKAPTATASNNGPSQYMTGPAPENFQEEGFARQGNNMTVSEDYMNRHLTVDFAKVLQDAKATPNIVDNQLRGFTLTRIRKDSIYEKAGFQDNDVVEEINGVPLNDTGQTIKFLNTLRGEKEIEIRIRRGGAVLNKTINIR